VALRTAPAFGANITRSPNWRGSSPRALLRIDREPKESRFENPNFEALCTDDVASTAVQRAVEPVVSGVATTTHTREPQRAVYNRCVVTRLLLRTIARTRFAYCNWFGYGEKPDRPISFPEPYALAAHSRTVTVRVQGVMENCTMFVATHPLRPRNAPSRGPLKFGTAINSRPLRASCPSRAIIFGERGG